jgi:hypothetical protein
VYSPNHPARAAPRNKDIDDFSPEIRNAIHKPGNTACAIASPVNDCFLNTVKVPMAAD